MPAQLSSSQQIQVRVHSELDWILKELALKMCGFWGVIITGKFNKVFNLDL